MTSGELIGEELLAQILAALPNGGRPVVLIDGGSGSGKTTLARALAPALPGAQLVRLDDFYPGWGGLEAGSRQVHDSVLAGTNPGWTRWDWADDKPAEWHPLDPDRPLIIEGSGCLSRANRARASLLSPASLAMWVSLDAATRKRRALARDGELYAPHWDRWAAQEVAFFERERPDLLADIVIEEHPSPPHRIVTRGALHPPKGTP